MKCALWPWTSLKSPVSTHKTDPWPCYSWLFWPASSSNSSQLSSGTCCASTFACSGTKCPFSFFQRYWSPFEYKKFSCPFALFTFHDKSSSLDKRTLRLIYGLGKSRTCLWTDVKLHAFLSTLSTATWGKIGPCFGCSYFGNRWLCYFSRATRPWTV